ncbi:MAG: radical SAM protein [Bacteroidales bacterium]
MRRSAFFGPPILHNGLINISPRLKTRFMTGIQYGLLRFFGSLTANTLSTAMFSRFARSLIGSYLYSLKVEINTWCNLNCKMCYVEKSDAELPYEIVTQIIKQIRRTGTRLEILGGEPFLRQDLSKIVHFAKTYGKVPFISVYTNGTYATKEVSHDLKQAGLDAAIVTLISHQADIQDDFTGVDGSWDETVEGIKNLRDAGIKTYTFTAVHQRNRKDIPAIHRFAEKELMVQPLFYQYIPQHKDDPLIINREEWYRIKNWILSRHPVHAEFVRNFYMLTGNACSGGNFVLTLKADGSVQPCPFISDIPLGNIYHEDIWKIYATRYSNKYLRDFKSLPDSCYSCTYASVCGGGCRASNNLHPGGYLSADFRCLGPYSEPFDRERVIPKTPCFF